MRFFSEIFSVESIKLFDNRGYTPIIMLFTAVALDANAFVKRKGFTRKALLRDQTIIDTSAIAIL